MKYRLSRLFTQNQSARSRQVFQITALVVVVLLLVLGGLIALNYASRNTLYLSPERLATRANQNFTVSVRVNSGKEPVNAVQANLSYPADKLQFVSLNYRGSAFRVQAEEIVESGTIRLARGMPGGTPSLAGDLLVANITFEALASSKVSFTEGSAVVRSADGINLLTGTIKGLSGPNARVNSGIYTTILSASVAESPPPPRPSSTSASPGTLSLVPSSQDVELGSNFSVSLRVNSGSTAVGAAQANLNFPANKLEYVGTSYVGSAFDIQAKEDISEGSLELARGVAPTETRAGDLLFAVVTFKAKAAGLADVKFGNESAIASPTGTNILTGTSGGSFNLQSAATTEAPTFDIKGTYAVPILLSLLLVLLGGAVWLAKIVFESSRKKSHSKAKKS